MSGSKFIHIGEVVALGDDDQVTISLNQLAACEGCKAKGKCGIVTGGESSSTTIMKVVSSDAKWLSVGERVEVSITYRVGMIAVLFTYLIPLVIFVGVIALLVVLGVEEGVAAIATFAILAIYYWVLYLLRDRFERVVQFGLRKL